MCSDTDVHSEVSATLIKHRHGQTELSLPGLAPVKWAKHDEPVLVVDEDGLWQLEVNTPCLQYKATKKGCQLPITRGKATACRNCTHSKKPCSFANAVLHTPMTSATPRALTTSAVVLRCQESRAARPRHNEDNLWPEVMNAQWVLCQGEWSNDHTFLLDEINQVQHSRPPKNDTASEESQTWGDKEDKEQEPEMGIENDSPNWEEDEEEGEDHPLPRPTTWAQLPQPLLHLQRHLGAKSPPCGGISGDTERAGARNLGLAQGDPHWDITSISGDGTTRAPGVTVLTMLPQRGREDAVIRRQSLLAKDRATKKGLGEPVAAPGGGTTDTRRRQAVVPQVQGRPQGIRGLVGARPPSILHQVPTVRERSHHIVATRVATAQGSVTRGEKDTYTAFRRRPKARATPNWKKFQEGWTTHIPLNYLTDKAVAEYGCNTSSLLTDMYAVNPARGLIQAEKILPSAGELKLSFGEWFQAWKCLLQHIKTYF
ncbi:hypothetical protein PUNSTDRAFT_138507 [Punctularia strigosozonata HHB-11173 SS5]|uniref:Uncharacterized protein n=1 Tax=Punctularia strigosozonata (strain HHB-11173) TaxID=741275 RepID=R7S228_PUNST|nr:uncharacterized protein PUNSTDRAFT_138507 [Punctularia strigosozonata HHB-11173 SS5]EIN04465.1 hypothetical protein PUNSTDRAFT_138507 [Punctularia strigosozonata HHB-11173 SS5]